MDGRSYGRFRSFAVGLPLVVLLALSAEAGDRSLADFARRPGETDDAPRFQRAVDACAGGAVLYVPAGKYVFAQTLFVTNLCSVELSAGAHVKAVAEMDWLVRIDHRWQRFVKTAPDVEQAENYGLFFRGGTFDANGLASCIAVDHFRHFTLENTVCLNGRKYGLGVQTMGDGYELMARNLYFKTLKRGLAGNVGIYSKGGDSHYTDIVIVDYTTGFWVAEDHGANRLTRVHVWGGTVPPPCPGQLPEMLKDSVCFRIESGGDILRDCYADTGATGYWLTGPGPETRMFGCSYYNNLIFGLREVTIIRHDRGCLLCEGFSAQRQTPETRMYAGSPEAKVRWGSAIIDHELRGGELK